MPTTHKCEPTEKLKDYIGQELYGKQRSTSHICAPLPDNAYFIAFQWCNIQNLQEENERISIYCNETEFVLFSDRTFCTSMLTTIQKFGDAYQSLAEFFFSLTAGDIDRLEEIEEDIANLEEEMISANRPNQSHGTRIILIRRSLLRMKRYYDQLCLITERLTENEKRIFSEDDILRFKAISRRSERLDEFVRHLRESVTQCREAYQAQIDIEQNQIMKIFTVIAAFFLPLTLIVGWYGMNFSLPEFGWHFGYLYVIILSIVICILCFFIVKKKEWF